MIADCSTFFLLHTVFFRKANFKIFCLNIQVVLVSLLYCRLQESQCLWSHWSSLSGETNLSVIFSFLVCVGYSSWIFIVHHCQTKQKLKLFLLFVCFYFSCFRSRRSSKSEIGICQMNTYLTTEQLKSMQVARGGKTPV